jgi:hypothetical protein
MTQLTAQEGFINFKQWTFSDQYFHVWTGSTAFIFKISPQQEITQ